MSPGPADGPFIPGSLGEPWLPAPYPVIKSLKGPVHQPSPAGAPQPLFPCTTLPELRVSPHVSLLGITIENPIRGNRIKRAVGSRCELCGKEEAPDNLVVHTIPGDGERPPGFMEPFLLVLCFRCHDAVHVFAAPPDEQEGLARQRPDAIRHEIRRILTCVPRPYTPPPTDMEEAYRDACSCRFRFGV